MASLSFKCPSCGAPLSFTPGSKGSICQYCGTESSLEQLEAYQEKEEAKGFTGEEKSMSDTGETVMAYHCGSCGAQVVTDDTTTASFCYYCHNPVILTSRLRGDFKPDQIIPFKITKKEAQEKLLAWAGNKKFLRKDFTSSSQLEKVTGVYLPYWFIDVHIDMDLKGKGYTYRIWTTGETEHKETKVFDIDKEGEATIQNISEPAFTKFEPELIESIFPYKFSELDEFKMPYLSGFFSESYDFTKQEMQPVFADRVSNYTGRIVRNATHEYDNVELSRKKVEASIAKWYYTLLPVWILTYHYRGSIYVYAVNGQTGESYGELPVDNKKLGITSIIIFIVIAVLIIIGGLTIW